MLLSVLLEYIAIGGRFSRFLDCRVNQFYTVIEQHHKLCISMAIHEVLTWIPNLCYSANVPCISQDVIQSVHSVVEVKRTDSESLP